MTLLALLAFARPAPVAQGWAGGPTMPALDGGTVWAGEDGAFQQWDDGSWVYVWRPLPGEEPPEMRWPERVMEARHELAFGGRQWNGGYLVGAGEDGDRVMVAQDEGGEWYMALYIPEAVLNPQEEFGPVGGFEARADAIVQALRGMSLEGE